MKHSKKVVVATIVAAALALALVPVAGSAGAQSSVRGVTSTEIKVEGLGYAAFYADAGKAAKVRFDEANSSGEIPGGRKINYLGFQDDASAKKGSNAEVRYDGLLVLRSPGNTQSFSLMRVND